MYAIQRVRCLKNVGLTPWPKGRLERTQFVRIGGKELSANFALNKVQGLFPLNKIVCLLFVLGTIMNHYQVSHLTSLLSTTLKSNLLHMAFQWGSSLKLCLICILHWRMMAPSGKKLGQSVWVTVQVTS